MKSSDKLLMLLFLSVILICAPVTATEMVGADQYNLGEGQVLDDDLMVAGGEIVIDGNVSGDLIAAGGNIELAGRVDDDAWIAGGSLIIDGKISDDLRAAGGDIHLYGSVADNAVIAGGRIRTGSKSSVGGDLNVAGGSIEIAGDVGGDLSCSGGSVVIGGSIDGNATIHADDIQILQSAMIRGNLEYTSDKEIEIPAGTVIGDVVYKRPPEPEKETFAESLYSETASFIISFLMILLIGLLLVRFAKNTTIRVSDTIAANFLKSLGAGLVLLIAIPLIALILMITVIGIPLGLIVLFTYIVILYISKIFVGLAVGKPIVKYVKKEVSSPNWHLITGLLVIALATMIPLAGFLISLIVILAGLGALVATCWSVYGESRGV